MLVRHLVPRLHIHNVPSIEHTDRYFPDFASGLKGQHIPGHAPFIMFLLTSFTRATRTGATQRLTSCEASVGYVLRILDSDLALDVSGVLADQHFCESVASTQHHHQKSSPRLLRITLPLLNKPSCLHSILPHSTTSEFSNPYISFPPLSTSLPCMRPYFIRQLREDFDKAYQAFDQALALCFVICLRSSLNRHLC